MKNLIVVLLLGLVGVGTAIAGDEWAVISDRAIPEGRVVATVKGDGKPIEFGPVIFLGHRLIKTAITDISRQEAPYLKGFAVVPDYYPGKQKAADGDLGSFVIASQIMFNGTVAEYQAVLAEAGGEQIANVKGIAQTVIGAGMLAVGAVFSNQWLGVLGMTAAGNSAEFGSFVKDDPTWFKAVGDAPAKTERVVVVLTWLDRRDESGDFVRTNAYSTLFLTRDVGRNRLAELVVQSYRHLLAQRSTVLSDKQRTWLNEHGWANIQLSQ